MITYKVGDVIQMDVKHFVDNAKHGLVVKCNISAQSTMSYINGKYRYGSMQMNGVWRYFTNTGNYTNSDIVNLDQVSSENGCTVYIVSMPRIGVRRR